jgi:hypothetical protein
MGNSSQVVALLGEATDDPDENEWYLDVPGGGKFTIEVKPHKQVEVRPQNKPAARPASVPSSPGLID